jgi:hypothetical protein
VSGGAEREVLFEITRVGDVQRIAAVDVETGVEVVVQAPASASLVDVRNLALRKLQRALEDKGSPPPKRPGTLV